MLDMNWIIECVQNNKYYFSKHGERERKRDNLTINEIEEAILTGRILENYENTGRGDSCLVVGFSAQGKPIHVLCGLRADWMVVITVYLPQPPKFINPFLRGKK
jgi:hypothetical protein